MNIEELKQNRVIEKEDALHPVAPIVAAVITGIVAGVSASAQDRLKNCNEIKEKVKTIIDNFVNPTFQTSRLNALSTSICDISVL